MGTSLLAVAVVWLLGCVWSFKEQAAFASSKGFTFPQLLPLVIDGFAVSAAGVSWAASLDARTALPARLVTVVAVAASSVSNGTWAYLRTGHDVIAVALGVAVPVAANLAFEVLLAELRRRVQRNRGLPAPVAVPYPRAIRMVLAPWQTFRAWRLLVLRLTDVSTLVPAYLTAPGSGAHTQAASSEGRLTQPSAGERGEVFPEPLWDGGEWLQRTDHDPGRGPVTEEITTAQPAGEVVVSPKAEVDLRTLTLADAVRTAFTHVGSDDIPAVVEWLAQRDVAVSSNYAYDVKRRTSLASTRAGDAPSRTGESEEVA